jgi:hypothetical protein
MRQPSFRCLLAVLAASAWSCGDENGGPEPAADAAVELDAGVELDAELDASELDADAQGEDAGESDAHPPRDARAEAAAPVKCDAVAPTECPTPSPVYSDVVPVIEQYCLSCHDGLGDQWPLTSYSHVVSWTEEIRGMMLNCSMPPPESGIEMPIEERQRVLEWLRCDSQE